MLSFLRRREIEGSNRVNEAKCRPLKMETNIKELLVLKTKAFNYSQVFNQMGEETFGKDIDQIFENTKKLKNWIEGIDQDKPSESLIEDYRKCIQDIANTCHISNKDSLPTVTFDDFCRYSFLHLAAACDLSSLIDELISCGANPNVLDKLGRTPLWQAVLRGAPLKFKAISVLIAKGTDPSIQMWNGFTALGYFNAHCEATSYVPESSADNVQLRALTLKDDVLRARKLLTPTIAESEQQVQKQVASSSMSRK